MFFIVLLKFEIDKRNLIEQNKMCLFDSIKSLIRICQFLGLAPFSFDRKTQKWQSNSFFIYWSIAIMFYNASVFVGSLIFNETFVNYKNSRIRVILTALVLSWNHVHAICAVVELFLHRHQQIKLFNMLESLNISYKKHLRIHINYLKLKRISRRIIIVWMCEILALLSCSSFYYIQTGNKRIIFYTLSFTISSVISKLSYGYSIILASLINEYIDVLNVYLKLTTKQYGYYACETFIHEFKWQATNHAKVHKVDLQLEIVLFMKNAYAKLWEGAVIIKNQMHCSLAIGLSNDIFILIFNGYWIFLNIFLKPEPLSAFLVQSAFIQADLTYLLFITHNYRNVIDTVS